MVMNKEDKENKKKMRTTTWTLPQELHMEILSWLPVKSLLSFKLVSKAWHILVNNPGFVKSHLDRAIAEQKHSLIFKSKDQQFHQLEAPYYTNATPLVVKDTHICAIRDALILVGSCNGLLCFEKDPKDFGPSRRRYRGLVIMNPSTRSYKELPEEPPDHDDDFSWYPIYEFGYSSVLDDYKVVRIAPSYDPDKSSEVKVYSMSTNSWRRARDNRYSLIWPSSTGEFLIEAFHWMGTKKDANRIISFNISEEKFREIPTPPDCRIHDKRTNVMILRGCLCMMISSTRDRPYCDCEIWAMNEYGVQESWTRQFVINNPYESALYKIFDTSTIHRIDDQLLIRGDNRNLYFYDTKKTRGIPVGGLTGGNWMEDYTYIESLVSLKFRETSTNFRVDAAGSG